MHRKTGKIFSSMALMLMISLLFSVWSVFPLSGGAAGAADPGDDGSIGGTDSAFFNFEGTLNGFAVDENDVSLVADATRAYAGNSSLKVSIPAGYEKVAVWIYPAPNNFISAGDTISLFAYMPSGVDFDIQSEITMNGFAAEHTSDRASSSIARDQWVEITHVVPDNMLSLSIYAVVIHSHGEAGTIWIDSIGSNRDSGPGGNDQLIVHYNDVVNEIKHDFWGVNYVAFWDTVQGSAGSREALKQAGIDYIRFPGGVPGNWYDWSYDYHSSPNEWSSTTPLDLWQYAQGAGAGIMWQTNPTDNEVNDPGRKNDPSGEHLQAMMDDFDSEGIKVQYYEIGNEIDLELLDTNGGPGQIDAYMPYIEAYHEQAAAIHAKDPDAFVLGPSGTNAFYWWALDSLGMFMKHVGNKEGTGDLDGVSLHWYPSGGNWKDQAPGWQANMNFIKSKIAEYDTRDLPLFITETSSGGGGSANARVSGALGMADIVGAYRDSGVQSVALFGAIHHVDNDYGFLYGQGESRPQDSPTPTYFILPIWTKAGNQVLKVDGMADVVEGVAAYASKKEDGSAQVVLINKSGDEKEMSVAFDGLNIINANVDIYEMRSNDGTALSKDVYYNGSLMPQPATELLPEPSREVSERNKFERTLPPYSMTLLDFTNVSTEPVACPMGAPMCLSEEIFNINDGFFQKKSVLASGSMRDYAIYVPSDYDPQKAYPLIVFNHGSGESRNEAMSDTYEWSLGLSEDLAYLGPTVQGIGNEIRRNQNRFKDTIVVFPQRPTSTPTNAVNMSVVKAVLDQTLTDYNIDRNRLYMTGLSDGGRATWYLGARWHEEYGFAALMPIAGGCNACTTEDVDVLAGIPTRAFHGTADASVNVSESRNIAQRIQDAGDGAPLLQFTEFAGVDHVESWELVYENGDIIAWLLAQRLGGNGGDNGTTDAAAALTGPATVLSGQQFELTAGLHGLPDNIYAVGMTVNYDPQQVEFIAAQSLQAGFSVYSQPIEDGKVKLLGSNAMEDSAITDSDQLVRLTFKAKTTANAQAAAITLSDIVISDAATEMEAADASCTLQIVPVNKADLSSLLTVAGSKLNAAEAGSFIGQYSPTEKTGLQAAIASATGVYEDPEATAADVEQAITTLNAKLDSLASSLKTLAGATEWSVGDLAVIAKYYGKSSADLDWGLYKALNITTSRDIGIADLAAVAMKIFQQ